MLNEYTKDNLMKLSKEQLISIIDDLSSMRFRIGCILVDCSKCHIEHEDAVEEIRECFTQSKYKSLNSENLGDVIDYNNGKITVEEFHERMLNYM